MRKMRMTGVALFVALFAALAIFTTGALARNAGVQQSSAIHGSVATYTRAVRPFGTIGVRRFGVVGVRPFGAVGVRRLGVVGVRPFRAIGVRRLGVVGVRPFRAISLRRFGVVGVRPFRAIGLRRFGVVGVRPFRAIGLRRFGVVGVNRRFRAFPRISVISSSFAGFRGCGCSCFGFCDFGNCGFGW